MRGYLIGSGWKDYQQHRRGLRHPLPRGLQQARRAARADLHAGDQGRAASHDENIAFERIVRAGRRGACAGRCGDISHRASTRDAVGVRARRAASSSPTPSSNSAWTRHGNLLLIDEVLTPDSSRFWPAATYRAGISPPSFDKQYVRDYLETLDWDKKPPPAMMMSRARACSAASV